MSATPVEVPSTYEPSEPYSELGTRLERLCEALNRFSTWCQETKETLSSAQSSSESNTSGPLHEAVLKLCR